MNWRLRWYEIRVFLIWLRLFRDFSFAWNYAFKTGAWGDALDGGYTPHEAVENELECWEP